MFWHQVKKKKKNKVIQKEQDKRKVPPVENCKTEKIAEKDHFYPHALNAINCNTSFILDIGTEE